MDTSDNKPKISDLKMGMVVSEDIINDITGQVIIHSGETIDEVSLTKIVDYRVAQAALKQYEESLDAPLNSADRQKENDEILKGSIPYLAESERQTFVNFKNQYSDAQIEAKQFIENINNGKDIAVDEIYDVSSTVLGSLNMRSDLFAYLNYMKKEGDYIYAHCVNLSLLCNIVGKWLELTDDEVKDLTCAGMLCDIGTIRVSPDILAKKEKLSPEEFGEIKMHPVYGHDIIKDLNVPQSVKLAVLQHHERVDGSGYPIGLKDDKISKLAKILSICDVYEAMVSIRPYRDRICPFTVIKEFEQNYYSKIDTKYLMSFLKNIAYNYLGRKVKLKSGRVGEVVFINNSRYSAPIIQLEDDTCIDLLYNKEDAVDYLL